MTSPADRINDIIDEAADQTDHIGAATNAGIQAISSTLGGTAMPVDPSTGALLSAAGPIIGGLVQGQVDATTGYVRGASDVATGYAHAAGDVATGYVNAGGDAVHAGRDALNDQFDAYRHAGSDVLDGFEHGDPTGGLIHAGGDLVAGQAHAVGDILGGIGHAATDIGTGVVHGVEHVTSGITQGVEDVVNGTVKEFGDVTHGVLEGAAHGLKSLFGGGESKDDILAKFGRESGLVVAATRVAADAGRAGLQHLSAQLNSGDGSAIGTADDLLEQGAPGLAYFSYFLPAYNAWTRQTRTRDALVTEYEAEKGLSFADYRADSELLRDVAKSLTGTEQTLQSAYNGVLPSWQGGAAANFEAKMTIFFKGATATQQAADDTGTMVASLVEGLQKIILAKAEVAISLYADTLTPGIDGKMAETVVKVAQDDTADDMKRVVLGLFRLQAHGRHAWDSDGYYSDDCLDDPSRQAAIKAAADWCNNVLVPQTDQRLRALTESCSETKTRVTEAFGEIVKQITGIKDPFAGMETATAPPSMPPTAPPPTGGPTSPGAPTTPTVHVPAAPTTPQNADPTVPTAPVHNPVPTLPTGSGGRPDGLPPGAHWIPAGVSLPPGWHQDPRTGETVPPGYRINPRTGQVERIGGTQQVAPPWSGHHGNPDVHHNKNGSVSLGRDRSVTIGREHGQHGAFTITETDPDGTVHTYRVHFNAEGEPVVHEMHGDGSGAGGFPHEPVVPDHPVIVDPGGSPRSPGPGGTPAAPGSTPWGGGPAGAPSAPVTSGPSGMPGGPGPVAADPPPAAHTGQHAGAHASNAAELQQGAHVGADNAIGTSTAGTGTGSPIAGAAAAPTGASGHASGFGGMPMGMGAGRGGGGEQEAPRKYPQKGDVVGEDDLEQWRRMGPVLGDQ